jgi:exodeoxyribonuclease VII large subunit
MLSRPLPIPAAVPPRPYTVSELLAEVGAALRQSWRDVSVAGEIGRFDRRGGHGYFTLKDRTGCLSAIIFSSDLERIPFEVRPGLEVVARGSLDLYAPQGKFQLKAVSLEPVGAGALQLAFEQLKARLAAEGLFEPARKRRLPLLARRLAIVTSPSGAAIRDILNVVRRRFAGVSVTIYPVRVQGVGAAVEIAAAIDAFSRRGGFDVLVVTRGGGSLEDLAAFNDERVARALARSSIPTISAVGHETDVTIADLVADVRAATPSAAAEIVVQRKEELTRRVDHANTRLQRTMSSTLALQRARLVGLARAEGLLRFRYRLRELFERLAQGRAALVATLERRPREYAARLSRAREALEAFPRRVELARKRERVERLGNLLAERMRVALKAGRERLAQDVRKLELVSPLAILSRGYAVAFREDSRAPLTSSEGVRLGDRIRVKLHEGEIRAVVREGGIVRRELPLFDGIGEEP